MSSGTTENEHNTTIDQLFEHIDFSKQDVQSIESEALERLSFLERACIARLYDLHAEQCPGLINILNTISEALFGIKDWIYFCSDRLSTTNREIQQIDSFRTMLQLQIKNQKKLLDLISLLVSHFGKPDEMIDIIRFSKLDSKELDNVLLSLTSILETVSVSTTQPQQEELSDLRVLGDLRAVKERIQYIHQLVSIFSNRLCDEINQIQSLSIDEKSRPGTMIKKYARLISNLKNLDSRRHMELENLYEQKAKEYYESMLIGKSDRNYPSPKDIQAGTVMHRLVDCIIQEGRIYLECFHRVSLDDTQSLDGKISRKAFAFLKSVFESIQEYLISMLDPSMLGSVRVTVILEGHLENQTKNPIECEWVYSILSDLFYKLSSNFDEALQTERTTIQQSTISLRKRPSVLPCVKRAVDLIGKMEQQLSTIPSLSIDQGTSTQSQEYPTLGTRDSSIKEGTLKTRVRYSYQTLLREVFDLFDQFEASIGDGKDLAHLYAVCILNYHSMYTLFREFRLPFLNMSCARPSKAKYEEKLKEFVQLMIRISLAPLIGFFEGVEASLRISSPEDVKFHPRYGKTAIKNLLQQYTGKEMKRIVEGLQDRIRQLFDAEEFSLSPVVIHSVQETFISRMKNWCMILDEYYNPKDTEMTEGGLVAFQFTMNELVSFFK